MCRDQDLASLPQRFISCLLTCDQCSVLSAIADAAGHKRGTVVQFFDDSDKKAQLTLTNPLGDAKACKNCSNSTCFVSFHRIPFPRILNYRCIRNTKITRSQAYILDQSRRQRHLASVSVKISKIQTYSGSMSSKVIDLGVNVKPIYDFLLVNNCNVSRICYRFRDIDV